MECTLFVLFKKKRKRRLYFTLCFIPFTALATLKPQAGLVAPQAIPASQPTAAVSDWLLFYFILSWQILITNTQYIPQLNKLVICHLSVRVMVQCPWRLVNKWEWPQRSFRRYYFLLIFYGLDTSFFSYAIPDSFPPSILVSAWLFFCLQLQAKATILTTERKKVLFCLLNFPHYIY